MATDSPTTGWVIGVVVLTVLAVALQIGMVMVEGNEDPPAAAGSPAHQSATTNMAAAASGNGRISLAGGNIGVGGGHLALLAGVVGVLVAGAVIAALVLIPGRDGEQNSENAAASASTPASTASAGAALLADVETPADTRDCDNAWSDQAHGVLTSGSKLGVTLQAPAERTIVLRGLEAQVVDASAPIEDPPEATEEGCGGVTAQRWFTVRLRAGATSSIVGSTNRDADPETAGRLPLTIKNDEPEQLYFRLDASAATYHFRILLKFASEGKSYTQVLDNGGQPFGVTPDPRKAK
ncbi:hypothetical protein ACTOB_004688 [Actinoplanes oblitus]|uniref:Uncharacterized protein n=1 Tax=Actinoplanes oblitus TaxID=3040509 RepID=A0ABY8W4E6_9ACTN|nr:hypothetical protein [Actinoplanes oblitus]WIM92734.1 hypothetical protein ACTOB_004688 [Actinoplanes oblitus]